MTEWSEFETTAEICTGLDAIRQMNCLYTGLEKSQIGQKVWLFN